MPLYITPGPAASAPRPATFGESNGTTVPEFSAVLVAKAVPARRRAMCKITALIIDTMKLRDMPATATSYFRCPLELGVRIAAKRNTRFRTAQIVRVLHTPYKMRRNAPAAATAGIVPSSGTQPATVHLAGLKALLEAERIT